MLVFFGFVVVLVFASIVGMRKRYLLRKKKREHARKLLTEMIGTYREIIDTNREIADIYRKQVEDFIKVNEKIDKNKESTSAKITYINGENYEG